MYSLCTAVLSAREPNTKDSLCPQGASSPAGVEEHRGARRRKLEGKTQCPTVGTLLNNLFIRQTIEYSLNHGFEDELGMCSIV